MRSQSSNIWSVALWLLLAAGACLTVHALELTAEDTDEVASTASRFAIEGKVYSPELLNFNSNWQKDTAVSINDGEFVGFLKQDGSFVISNVPSGSYVVDIVNPEYWYESVSCLMGSPVAYISSFMNVFVHKSSIAVPRRNQPQGQVPCTQTELRAALAGRPGAIPAQDEGDDSLQVLPDPRTVEDHRFPVQLDGTDDGAAAAADARPAQDDERPGNAQGDGEYEPEQDDRRYARRQRNDLVVLFAAKGGRYTGSRAGPKRRRRIDDVDQQIEQGTGKDEQEA